MPTDEIIDWIESHLPTDYDWEDGDKDEIKDALEEKDLLSPQLEGFLSHEEGKGYDMVQDRIILPIIERRTAIRDVETYGDITEDIETDVYETEEIQDELERVQKTLVRIKSPGTLEGIRETVSPEAADELVDELARKEAELILRDQVSRARSDRRLIQLSGDMAEIGITQTVSARIINRRAEEIDSDFRLA